MSQSSTLHLCENDNKPGEVMQRQSESSKRFQMVKLLREACRHRGKVNLMWDIAEKRHVAIKSMPRKLVPCKRECPSKEVAMRKFLSSVGYPYGCRVLDVYENDQETAVVTDWTSSGDFFSWSTGLADTPPGPEREALVRPLAIQLLQGIRQLHDLGIVHKDISAESVLVNMHAGVSSLQLNDFGFSSKQRFCSDGPSGRISYQAPEMHVGTYDAFLSDAFAAGVTLYCVLLEDYPWLSTKQPGCKCFDYVREHGFRAYLSKRRVRGSRHTLRSRLSEPVVQLLEGLLAFDPEKRFTLGEAAWSSGESTRKSVWDADWLREACCHIPEDACPIAKKAKVA